MKQNVSTGFIIFLIALSLSLLIFSIYAMNRLDPGKKASPKGVTYNVEGLFSGEFDLTDINGNNFTQKNLLGKTSLIYFGFTSCPDICPTSLQIISNALKLLSEKELENIQVLFVTLDPKRDTKEHLKEYLANFHEKILGLYGNEEQLKRIVEVFKVFYQIIGEDKNYMLDHTSLIYMMDKNGKFVTSFTDKAHAEDIANFIKKQS